MIITPRPYFSWSQYFLFGRSPEEYRRRYILGEKGFTTKQTIFGKEMALIREGKQGTEDILIESIKNFLPQYPVREKEMEIKVMINGKAVVLLGKPDGVDPKKHIIGDDKTGKLWTQKMADESEQLTWYAYIYWKIKGVIPKLQINWIETEIVDGLVVATGNVKTFETTRSVKDFIVLQSRINHRWKGILELCEKEWSEVL